MSENPMSLKRRADDLRKQANNELDGKRRADLRDLAADLEQQYRRAMRPHWG